MCEARGRNGRSDGYAIGMECEGSARMEEGKRNQAGYIPEYVKFTESRWRLRINNPRQHFTQQNKYVYTTNYWYDTT